MPRTRAFYSVLQYIPDGGRAEAANVGVVLYIPGPGRVEVQTSPTLDRVKMFFSPDLSEFRRIELAVKSAESRLKAAQGEFPTEEEFARFVSARADAVRLTPPRLVVLTETGPNLGKLYADLVGDGEAPPPSMGRIHVEPLVTIPHPERDTSRPRGRKGVLTEGFPIDCAKIQEAVVDRTKHEVPLPSRLLEVFSRLEAIKKGWQPGRVTVPQTKQKIAIPFAYKNGRVNYVLPQSLAAANRYETRLQKLAFQGLLIYQHEINHERGQLIVLSADDQADRGTEQRYAEVLDDFHVRFVPHDQADGFAAEVEQTAH